MEQNDWFCLYKGIVRQDQTDGRDEMRLDAATSVAADALAVYLELAKLTSELADGPTSAGHPIVSFMSIQRLGAAPPKAGEVYECRTGPALAQAPPGQFRAELIGPHGAAWLASIGAPLGARRPALQHRCSASDEPLPAVRILQRMHKHQCDQAGHVNVQVFFELVDEAVAVLWQEVRAPGPRWQIVQARASFKSELFAGDVVTVHSGIRGMDPQGVDAVHGIVHQPSGRLVCVIETRLAQLHASGRSADWEFDAQAFKAAQVCEWRSLPPARPPAAPRVPARPDPAALTSCVAVVDSWDADGEGWLRTRSLIDMCSTGARQYLARIGLDGARFAREKITVAAIDYLLEIQKRPRVGCNLTLRSAYLSGSAKAIRFSHHLMDSDRDEVYATVEIVGVMLDLLTHRATEVPQDVKERLRSWP